MDEKIKLEPVNDRLKETITLLLDKIIELNMTILLLEMERAERHTLMMDTNHKLQHYKSLYMKKVRKGDKK
jgi:hypothetical protein